MTLAPIALFLEFSTHSLRSAVAFQSRLLRVYQNKTSLRARVLYSFEGVVFTVVAGRIPRKKLKGSE